MKKYKIGLVLIILISFLIAAVSLIFLGDIIPIHFGIDGKPDQFGGKYFILIFPVLSLIIGLTMLLVAKYGKVTENYTKYLLLTGLLIEGIFTVLLVALICYALSYSEQFPNFDISKFIMITFGCLFLLMGNFMPKIERNRSLGLKCKWSLYNDTTWQKTHRILGFGGVIVGILCIIFSMFFKDVVNFIILMLLILILMVTSIIASYIYYKQEKELEIRE